MRTFLAACLCGLAGTFGAAAAEVAADAVPLDADVVVMGELHDVPAHHANQAAWIERLSPSAIVFEMLAPEQGAVAEARRMDPADTLGAALEWEARGWPDFTAYDPIFKASGDAAILGAEVPRAALGRAVADGAAAAFAGDAATFGLDAALPGADRTAREAEQAEAHCGLLPDEMLPGMVEAQRLRDATLAARTLEALDRTGGPVAVVTGNGHARRDRGVPAMLAHARPDIAVTSIGQFTEPEADAPYDVWVVTPDDREAAADPCDALR